MDNTRTVIFDLDGTLLDTLTDLYNACNFALKSNGYRERTRNEIRQFVGNGFSKLIKRSMYLGNVSEKNIENEIFLSHRNEEENFRKIFSDAKSYYGVHSQDNTRLYDGIEDMLRELKERDIKMGVVSNKPDDDVKKLCGKYFSSYISLETSVGDKSALGMKGFKPKPSPDPVFEVMETLGAKKDSTIYIGDSDVDIQTALNAGIRCISVTWGFRDEDFLREHGASVLISRPQELLGHLDGK